MAIVGCEHHSGMGLCSACLKEQERWSDDSYRRSHRREELEDAAGIAAKYGLHDIASALRREARS